MALCKAQSAGSGLDTVIQQDLSVGTEGSGLDTGDSVEVRFTGWLFEGGTFGPVSCDVSKYDVINMHWAEPTIRT